MAPKFTPAELEAFIKLGTKLTERTVPLSEAGAKGLAKLAPHEQVALDELLGRSAARGETTGTDAWKSSLLRDQPGAWKLGEVQGTGAPGYEYNAGWQDTGPLWRQADDQLYDTTTKPDIGPRFKSIGQSSQDAWRSGVSASRASDIGLMRGLNRGEAEQVADRARLATDDAIEANTAISYVNRDPQAWSDASRRAGYPVAEGRKPEGQRVGAWPEAWLKTENIPAITGTVGAGAALLGAGKAQAAEQPGIRWDDEKEPAGVTWDDETQEQDLTGGMSVGQPAPIVNPRAGLESGTVTEDGETPNIPFHDQAAQMANGFLSAQPVQDVISQEQQGYDALVKFKKEHITPVIKAMQGVMRNTYMGERGGGFKRQDNNPALAVNIESVLHPFIGETLGNAGTQETGAFSEGPAPEGDAARLRNAADAQVQEHLGPTLGTLYSAAAASFSSGFANLPIFMIPGLGNGFLGGTALGMLDEDVSPGAGALLGGAGNAVLSGGAKLLGKAKEAITKAGTGAGERLSKFLPIAVIPPGEEANLAAAIHAMPSEEEWVAQAEARQRARAAAGKGGNAAEYAKPSLPPTGIPQSMPEGMSREAVQKDVLAKIAAVEPKVEAKVGAAEEARFNALGKTGAQSPLAGKRNPLVVAVDVTPEGQPVSKGLFLTPDGVHSAVPPEGYRGKIVATEAAKTAALGDPQGPVAQALKPVGEQAERLIKPGVTREDLPSLIHDGLHIVEAGDEGSVLSLSDEGAVLHDVDDPALQLKLARASDPESSIQALKKQVEEMRAANALMAEDLARGEADQTAAAMDTALGGNGNGDKLPPNPPMDPPMAPPPNPHNVDQLEEMRVKWWQKIRRDVNRKLLSPTVYGPLYDSDKAMSAFSIDTFTRLRDDVLTALETATPGLSKAPPAKVRAVQQDLSRFITGDIKFDQLKKLHPELDSKAYELVQQYKETVRLNEVKLRELGMLQPAESLLKLMKLPRDGDLPEYATRMYYRFLMKPGEWARYLARDTAKTERLVGEIVKDVFGHEKYVNWTPQSKRIEARKYLELLSGDPERIADLGKEGSKLGTYLADGRQSLKARKDLPAWQREALGEVDNGFVRIAESITRQEQLLLQGEMWRSVAANPQMATVADAADVAASLGHTKQLPMDPAKFGLAAGFRVSPDTYFALVTAPQGQRNAAAATSRFVNALKYGQTVANPGSWVTNFFANSQGAVLSNLVNPFVSPATVGHGMYIYAKDGLAHSSGPGLRDTVPRQRFMRAMELGLIDSSYANSEFRRSASEFGREVIKATDSNPNKVLDVLQYLPERLKGAKDSLAHGYSSIDSAWKYSVYVNGLRKGGIGTDGQMNVKKAIDFIGARYRPGMLLPSIRENVELEVARRIHFSFPMMDRVGEGVAKATGSNLVGTVVNPYIKVKSELIRNYAQLPGRLTEKGMMANLAGYGLMAGGTLALLAHKREQAGINQDELDKAFATAPRALQRFKPGAMALWYRDSKGQPQTIDMTQMFEPLTWLQGNPQSSAPTRFLQSMALTGTNGSLAEGPTADYLSSTGLVDPAFNTKPIPEWNRSGATALQEGISKLGPGVIRNTYNTVSKTEGMGFQPPRVRGPTVPQMDQETGITNLLTGPGRITPIGSPEQRTREIQALAGEIQQARRELADVGLMRDGQSYGNLSGPLNKAEAMKKARAVLDQKVARMKAMQQQLSPEPTHPSIQWDD